MKRLLLITTCLLAAPAFAQVAGMQSPAYQECAALSNSNPAQALAKAEAWLRIDNGIAAQHCHAMALYGLHRYAKAADALNSIRAAIAPENITLRTYITRQAARAYINASAADRALALLNSEIGEIGNTKGDNAHAAHLTSDLLLDRARLNVTYGKLEEAAKDLDHAVSLTPVNEEVLLQRASVFEKLGDPSLAKSDVDAVLVINSGNSQARQMRDRLSGTPRPVAVPSTILTPQQPFTNVAPTVAPTTATAAPTMPVTTNPNNQETSTLTAPTPMLSSSTTSAPQDAADTSPPAPAPVHKHRRTSAAATQPLAQPAANDPNAP